ncbi:carbon-nitrogen hydrolase family protein [Rhodoferax sp. PAMC 29310]|uniref:carbon-nitrogen hydrolase family protein n=1 Tax=Rhodoferax sp. PAMC 29310 TaxID=2822760 RepID=UPI001B3268BA|nr:carbon-nitrogen hydrolase family protein [Rhodoferax sp. PAMC 29310]
MKNPLTLALYQCTPAPLDVPANLRRLETAAEQAAQGGADVLVCPEMFLTGYNISFDAVRQLAQAANGDYAQAVADIARRHAIALLYGYPELGDGGAVFNAAQWISAAGERCLNYRKTHLYGALDKTQFSPGRPTPGWVDLKGWRVGVLICYDVEFPENTRRLALEGAELIAVPTANMPEFDFVSKALVPVRAYENQVYVAYANYVGSEGAVIYGGLSTVAAPDGALLAQAGHEETLVFATLLAPRLAAARLHCSHLTDVKAP